MSQFIKMIIDFLKNTQMVYLFQKERFIVNLSAEIIRYIKDICKIPPEESILLVLDDSLFKNLKQIVVFTDKKIYWTVKNASLKLKQGNAKMDIKGQGLVFNQLLKNVSIFSKREKDIKFIFIVSEDVQLIIPFAHFQIETALAISFYNYILNYCGGYKPDNAKNEAIYRNISKTSKIVKINIVAKLFNALFYIAALSLTANVVLRYFGHYIIENEKLMCVLVGLRCMSIIFGYKKSMYSNLLLFILTYNIISLSEVNHYWGNGVIFLLYTGTMILFGTFDFDKIFRYLTFVLAIVSAGYLIATYFDIEMILRYLP